MLSIELELEARCNETKPIKRVRFSPLPLDSVDSVERMFPTASKMVARKYRTTYPAPIGSDGRPQVWCATEKMWFAQGPIKTIRKSKRMPNVSSV